MEHGWRRYPRPVPPAKRTARRRAGGDDPPHGAAWRLLTPFLVFGVAALAAALHRALGEPLGPAATAKLADLWQAMAMASVVYAPIYGQYKRQHALAQRTEQRQLGGLPALTTTLSREEAHDHEHDGPLPRSDARRS